MKKQIKPQSQQYSIDSSASSYDTSYVANLKNQCSIRYTALKTAENLIQAYQKQNQFLKDQNQKLKNQVEALSTKEKVRQQDQHQLQTLRKKFFKYSQRINELLEQGIEKDRRLSALEKEITYLQEKQMRIRQHQLEKSRHKEKLEKKKKMQEQKFNNFLRISVPSDSFCSMNSNTSSKKQPNSILQCQLQRKDKQIMILLRRLRDLEDQAKNCSRKQRLKTSDTYMNKSVRKNTYSSIEQ